MTNNPAFEAYYTAIYGSRWALLRESLLAPHTGVAYGQGLTTPYLLDAASILAAVSLRLGVAVNTTRADDGNDTMGSTENRAADEGAAGTDDGGCEILDACAAPGGKTLVIASRIMPGMRLLANEISSERRRRLAAVLDEYLPPERRQQVRVSGFDAAAAGGKRSERDRFNGILLDAPCSSERHVLNDPAALLAWTPARPRFLAKRQWSLLSAAFLLLKPGGSLVYATCALSPEENDGVAGRLLEKYGASPAQAAGTSNAAAASNTARARGNSEASEGAPGTARLDPPDFSEGEVTRYGRIILPDICNGIGPMYVARFSKAGC
jgi:16S rRNA (cytosine1407-C5)-methyltransferase